MTNDQAYAKLIERKCTREGALRLLIYAYQAQYIGSWKAMVVNDSQSLTFGGSEAAKEMAMDVFRDAGIDPMAVSFPERVVGKSPYSRN